MLVRYFEQGEVWHGASELVREYQIQKEIKLKKFMDGFPQLAYLLCGYIIVESIRTDFTHVKY